MRFFAATFATLAVLAAPILAAPSAMLPVETYNGETSGKYIVKFKEGVSPQTWVKKLGLAKATNFHVINGLASHLSSDALNTLRTSPDVASISEDGVMHTTEIVTQTDAPWGLQRISSAAKIASTDTSALTYTYTYDTSAGSGVDIYVVDTGVYVEHEQFGGRATWGWAATTYGMADGYGHGTHCAGTAVGSTYGVSKNASIIAVKVLSDAGSGYVSDIVDGLNWVISNVNTTGKPSIVTMSLGGGASSPLDAAVASLTAAGIHVTVAAGNSNTDAANTSPARAPSAITVGASGIDDARAYFSNYGPIVDVFAPGLNVISSWIGSPNATNNISGTSMATPHVAGLAAYLIALEGNLSPADLSAKIQGYSVKGALTAIPTGTINDLAYNSAT